MPEKDSRAPDFRAVFEAASEPSLVLAPDPPRFTIIAVSDAYLVATSTRREDLVGRGLFDVLPDGDTGEGSLRGSLERVVRDGVPDALAVRRHDVPRAGGGADARYWRPLNSPVLDARGELACIIHRLEEVTGAVRLQEHGRELDALRSSAAATETRLRRILERITDAFCSLDSDWCFTYVNEGAQRVISALVEGTGPLLGRCLWKAIPALEGSRFADEYRRAMREQQSAHFEEFFPPANAWFEVHAYPAPDGLSIFFRDVTARRRTEVRLRTLESVITAASDSVVITEPGPLDEPGPRIVYVNAGFCRMTGYTPEEVLGRSPRILQGPGTDREARARIREALERGEPIQVELLNYKKDATPFWTDISIVPVRDAQGRLVHWASVQRDTTGRRNAEASALHLAREEAARLQAEAGERATAGILESITDAFLALDTQWRFTYINRRAEEYLERGREELLGKVLWDVFPETWSSPFGQQYRRAMREQTSSALEAFSPSRKRWFLVHTYPSANGLSVYFHDVTEHRRMAEALRESELRYRTLFDNSMDAVLLTAPDGGILMANRACTEMFGYSEQELQTLGRQAVVDMSDPRLGLALEERRRTGRFRGELTMKRADGTRFPVEASSAVFRDEQGRERSSLFVRDISRRKEAEAERERLLAELDGERRWYKAVLDHVPLGIILFEPGGGLYLNRRTEELLGMKVSSTGGIQYAGRLLHPDGTPVPPEQFIATRVLQAGETVLGAEFLVECPDGSRIPILGSAAPIRDSGGKVIGAVGTFQDISERMRAEEAIRASERLLSAIFEILPVGLWLTDARGRIVRTNPAAQRICGDIRVGASLLDAYQVWWADTGRPVAPEERPLARALTQGETSLGELMRLQCADGTRKFIVNSALPLHDEHSRFAGAIGVHEDVTKLKETEDALRRALQSRDDVLGIVAHDLRNPLNGILLQLQFLLRRGCPLGPREQQALEATRRHALRMNRLIQDLLDVARMEAGALSLQREAMAPERLLAEVYESQRALASEAFVDLRLEPCGELPALWGDRERLVQVLENLIGNAVKFTGRGGHIRVGAAARGGEVLLWVADDGQGIPAEHLPHLFDRFWQASRKDKRGAGLGLAIVKGIVDSHRGRIWAESQVGVGTTFYVTIPAAQGAEASLNDAR